MSQAPSVALFEEALTRFEEAAVARSGIGAFSRQERAKIEERYERLRASLIDFVRARL